MLGGKTKISPFRTCNRYSFIRIPKYIDLAVLVPSFGWGNLRYFRWLLKTWAANGGIPSLPIVELTFLPVVNK
jgi:hypothetical protein